MNLINDPPRNLPEELVTRLVDAASVHIDRIVSHGHASPAGFWYGQSQHEWVVVLRGAATPGATAGLPAVQWIDAA